MGGSHRLEVSSTEVSTTQVLVAKHVASPQDCMWVYGLPGPSKFWWIYLVPHDYWGCILSLFGSKWVVGYQVVGVLRVPRIILTTPHTPASPLRKIHISCCKADGQCIAGFFFRPIAALLGLLSATTKTQHNTPTRTWSFQREVYHNLGFPFPCLYLYP